MTVRRRAHQLLRRRPGPLLVSLAVLAAAMLLWPAALGGATTLVVIRGASMEPTYQSGDLILVRATDQPAVGDAAAVRVAGQSDALVMHRIITVEPNGTLITQGDNRSTPDGFTSQPEDVVGTARLRIPAGGHVLLLLASWQSIALLSGLLVGILVWDRTRTSVQSVR